MIPHEAKIKLIAPIHFAATNVRMVTLFPGSPDALWQADIRACRAGEGTWDFDGVLFVESGGTAYIYGIENESGRPEGVEEGVAEKQQSFIEFLREQTRMDNEALGFMAVVFEGIEYVAEGRATAAYIAERLQSGGDLRAMGMGVLDEEGEYHRFMVNLSDDPSWIEMARLRTYETLCDNTLTH